MGNYLLNALVTLLVTIDPPGLAPIFVVLTAGRTTAERRAIALRAVIIAGVVLTGFALVGEPLIGFLGISLPAFRVAGGLLLFVIAFEMVFGHREQRKSEQAQNVVERDHLHHVAVFPIAIPLLAGPAAISATILLASQSPAPAPAGLFGLLAIIASIMALCFTLLQSANAIERILGETGRIVVSRLLGLILAALSVQFVMDGLREVLVEILR